MATQKHRSESTRAQLLKAFRASFLKCGFDATTTQQVLAETGLSKGAMYHHFRSKADIIQALYEDESRNAIERAVKRVDNDGTPLTRLRDVYIAWMQEVRSPSVSKMLFEIGPSALGSRRAKEIEDEISLKRIEALLDEAATAGEIELQDAKLTAALLNALVGEAALHRLRTGKDTTAVLKRTLDAVLDSLRAGAD